MINPKIDSATANVEKPLRTTHIIWFAFFGSFTMFVLFSEMTKSAYIDGVEGDMGNPTVALALLLAGVAVVVASFVVKRMLMSKAVAARSLARVQNAYQVAFVLCEVSYLCGFVMRFRVVTNLHYILFILGALGLLLHKPRRDDFLNAAFDQKA
ncbi:MAG TPA: hypothetical protein VF666_16665 [Pyrinomonadaceae bacterium]|jgi:hypothetical protein